MLDSLVVLCFSESESQRGFQGVYQEKKLCSFGLELQRGLTQGHESFISPTEERLFFSTHRSQSTHAVF